MASHMAPMCKHHALSATRQTFPAASPALPARRSLRPAPGRHRQAHHAPHIRCRYTSAPHLDAEEFSLAEPGTQDFLTGEDFYQILGVSPTATAKDVKRAYYGLMREVHPDRNSDDLSHELCTLLNEIYETLADPEKRATYDAIAGFAVDSVNPWKDNSYPPDQVFVDEVSCIGCGKCVRACPASFKIEESLYGRARVIKQGADTQDDIGIAMETCPVDCIHWVTTPQLSLLEVALSNMGRITVSTMMRFGRSGGDVFKEAQVAWQKRQASIAQRRQEAQRAADSPGFGWSFFNQNVEYRKSGADEFGGNGNGSGAGGGRARDAKGDRKIADLAAAAATAARLWRHHQGGKKSLKALVD